MFKSTDQKKIISQIKALMYEAGSHSPNIFTYKQKLPELDIK
jgi:hypothetical protein